MESSATRNYERQLENTGLTTETGFLPNNEPALANEQVTGSANTEASKVLPAAAPKPANRKGFWFRWR
jgi:hypothetical protein